jgi:hypothetical protein
VFEPLAATALPEDHGLDPHGHRNPRASRACWSLCKPARKFFGGTARVWIAHFRAQQSDVECPGQIKAGANRRGISGVSTFDLKQTATGRLAQPHATSSSTFTEVGLRGVE